MSGPITRRIGKGVNTPMDDGAMVVTPLLPIQHPEKRIWRCPGCGSFDECQCELGPLDSPVACHATQDPISGNVSPALGRNSYMGVAFSENQRGEVLEHDIAHQLTGGGGKPGQGYPAARVGSAVRRLTPTECERLMGWVDGWTLPGGPSLADAPSWYHLPPEQRDPAPVDPPPDGPRYAACGDGVVAPVAEWIGRRILAVAAGERLEEAA